MALAGMSLAVPLFAQPPLSAKEAVARALASHPSLAAGTARIAASAALAGQAGLRPNPRLLLQSENWRSYGNFHPNEDVDHYANLTQPIETGSKRTLRVEAARAGVRRAELERELLSKQLAARVKHAYWSAAGAARIYELWTENARNFGQIVVYHEARVREGAMAEADLLKVRLEEQRLAVAANTAGLDAERARIQLLREMAQSDFSPLAFDSLDPGAPPAPADVTEALRERTEIKLARQAVDAAGSNIRLQKANAKPDVNFILGYKRTFGFHTATAGMEVPLPLFNRNQGNIGAATAEMRAWESEVAAAEALVRAEVRAAQAEVEMRRRQITELLKGSLERAAESSRIALAAYREGGADLLRLLDAERTRIELEVLYARTLADYRVSVVALETALGVEP